MLKKLLIICNLFTIICNFIPNAFNIMLKESNSLSNLLLINNLPCYLISSRIKTFESTYNKLITHNIKDLYSIHDLIGFRYVLYSKEDLLKFYHYIKLERSIMYTKNYIIDPKKNGYKAFHIRYNNPYKECPIRQLECQLYIIEDYYDSLYGNSTYNKTYYLI